MTNTVINIVSARQVGDYSLHLVFSDDIEQVVDFKPFLSKSPHPDIRLWLTPQKFSSFRIEYGELVWGDYELCFSVIDLYRNQLDHSYLLEAAA